MGSLTERFTGYKPLSYEVSANVAGGQFVVADTANPGKVKPALAAEAALWLGMAKYDAEPGVEFGESAVQYYNVPINNPTPRHVACPHLGVYDVVNVGGTAIPVGQPLTLNDDGYAVAGVVGGATPTDARAIVGICLGAVVNGVWSATPVAASATAVYRIRLGRV